MWNAPTMAAMPTAAPQPQPGYGYPHPGQAPGYGYPGPGQTSGYGYPHPGQVPGAAPGMPGQWQAQGFQPAPGNKGKKIAAGVTAGVVVLALAGGAYLLGHNGSNSGSASADSRHPATGHRQPGGSGGSGAGGAQGGAGGGQGGADGGQGGPSDSKTATDPLSGIDLPVLSGWTGESSQAGAGVTTGPYTCPGGDKTEMCVRGGVFSQPAIALNDTAAAPQEIAQQDIGTNAQQSYGDPYGGLTSHQQLESKAVTVAGVKGYLVRWKVATGKGVSGYVQSVAFPSPEPGLTDEMVVVRYGFDISSKAPTLSDMDKITAGITAAQPGEGAGAAGGAGEGGADGGSGKGV
jgi:hypothetical protein